MRRRQHGKANATYAAELELWCDWTARGRPAEVLSIVAVREMAERLGVTGVDILRAPSGSYPAAGRYYRAGEGGLPPRIRLGSHVPLWLVLHELAHHVASDDRGHGRRFRDAYVMLVRLELGDWWADRLARKFVGFCGDEMRRA